MKKSGKAPAKDAEGGILHVTVVNATNIAGLHKDSANSYITLSCSFNKQRFKSRVIKKSTSPTFNEKFQFYISEPQGELYVKIFDKEKLKSDVSLGEATIPLKKLADGKPWEESFELKDEPKKKKKGNEKGHIKLKLHFPMPEKENKKQEAKTPAAASVPSSPVKEEKTNIKKLIKEVYDIGPEIGKGGFSVVHKATHRQTADVVAIKIILKNQAEEELQLLQREIDIMRKLRHKNIIALHEVYDEPDTIYLVMELVTGGELFDQIVSRGTYSERDAAAVVRQILEAVEYMHSNGIAHRDLKPENLLCSGPDNTIIKVTDFGLSKDFGTATLKTSCGTPDYVAPEVLKGQPYDNSVDIWSIGVITYILLCGFPPFYGTNDQQIFEKILKGEYDFPSPDWDNISTEAKEFISAILVLDQTKRPTASECLEAPWIQSKAPARPLQSMDSFRAGMGEYTAKRKKGNN